MVPILIYGMGSEVAKWTAAKGQLLCDAGETERGLEFLEQAVEKSPHDQNLKLQLADQLMPRGRADEALELVDAVLEKSIDLRPGLYAKANCLSFLGRPVEALKTIKQIPELEMPGKNTENLNTLAYFRALAGTELRMAREDIDEAIELFRLDSWWLDKVPMELRDQLLVETAMVANRIGRGELVLDALSSRIGGVELKLLQSQRVVSEKIYRDMQTQWPPAKKNDEGLYLRQIDLYSQKQHIAVLLTVRGLIYQKLGELELCDADRVAVRHLDHETNRILKYMPRDWSMLQSLSIGARYLDTRAMVTAARKDGDLSDAIADLDAAILAIDVWNLTSDSQLQNTLEAPRGLDFDTAGQKRLEAVLLKHRADICERAGQRKKAASDRKRIAELGFDDKDVLF